MKKSLIATALLGACAGVAHAQGNVTINGSIDVGVRYQTHVGTTAANRDSDRISMGSNGTYHSNRLGFAGGEDLGGGMNAHFFLETGFNSGTGANVDPTRFFNRIASVGIGGSFGSLDLGRQYTVALQTVFDYDPFSFKFPVITPSTAANIAAGTRFDNDIQYTGVFGPLTFRAEHALGEVSGSASAGSANASGLTYTSGPFLLGVAYTWRKMGATSGNLGAGATNVAVSAIPVGTLQANKHWTVGGAYNFGAFRLAGGYADEKQNNGPLVDTRIKNGWLGGNYKITRAVGLTAAWYHTKTTAPGTVGSPTGFDGKKDLFIAGLAYALSKRTNLYADVDTAKFRGSNVGSATPGGPGTGPFAQERTAGQKRTTGVSVGINHLFSSAP
jgi:predicted porin